MNAIFRRMQKRYAVTLLGLFLWLILTLAPWQGWLGGQYAIRFIISFVIFLLPGSLAAILIDRARPVNWPRLVLIGLTISTTLAGLLGLFARLLQLSFVFIQTGYLVIGAILLVGFLTFYEKGEGQPLVINFWEVLSLLIAVAVAVFIARMSLPRPIHDDSYTYNALVYYYQHAEALTFGFPAPLDRLNISRFWLAFWPLVEAILAGFSKVDGLLITGVYLAPALAVFALMATFALGRALGLSRHGAALAVVAQGFSLIRLSETNSPGFEFFSQLIEDKAVAAFIICPILFLLVIEYLENPEWRRLLLVGLGALAALFTHPVIFGMSCMIIGLYGFIALFHRQQRGAYLKLILLLILLTLIPYSFRFGDAGPQTGFNFTLRDLIQNGQESKLSGRVSYYANTPFYGISPEILKGMPFRISIAAWMVALFFFLKNKLARFTLAAFLVLGLSTLPYTGWLVGFFTTPQLLPRLTWLMPFGFAFALIVQVAEGLVLEKIKILGKFTNLLRPLAYIGAQAILIAGLIYTLPWATLNLGKPETNLRAYYAQYIDMGDVMNELELDHQPIIIGGPDETTNAILPSLTLKLWPLFFRVEIQGSQRDGWEALVGDKVEVHERYSRLVENHVEYLLVRNLAPWMQELLDVYPQNFKKIHWNSYLVLFRLNP
jgi:hypothetical protein